MHARAYLLFALLWVGSTSLWGGGQALGQEAEPRYQAVLRDGSKLAGNVILPWHYAGAHPKLADRLLFEPSNPTRWLRDTRLEESAPRAFIEFAGGDRLPGTVLGYSETATLAGEAGPANFEVQPLVSLAWPTAAHQPLKVTAPWVRRIVWEAESGPRKFQPQTAFLRDGRVLQYRSLQFLTSGVRLLLDQAIEHFEFTDLRELHLPKRSAWDVYFEQLAALAPGEGDLLERIVTTDGLRATSTTERFLPRWHQSHDTHNWYHAIQPAWSLQPLYVRFVHICERRYHPPHEVPWSCLDIELDAEALASEGAAVEANPAAIGAMSLASRWPAQSDRNVFGGRLRRGGDEFNWGLGTHAPSRVTIPLPACARAVQTRLALDDSVGSRGGCARAEVLQGSRTLYTSPVLVGCGDLQDTGPLELDPALARELTLLVDPQSNPRPAGADPLNIRDLVNWLEGVVVLDRLQLAEEVARRAVVAIPAWAGWTIEPLGPHDPFPFQVRNHWDSITDADHPAWRLQTIARVPFARISQQLTVPGERPTLAIYVSRFAEHSDPGKLQVQVNGEPVLKASVPERSKGRTVDPIRVSLAAFAGQTVKVEIIPWPLGEQAKLDWRGMGWE